MATKIKGEDKAIQYMKENGSATVRELCVYCDINSPTKVISNLHKLGLIEKENCKRTNQNGETKHFKRYYLRKEVA